MYEGIIIHYNEIAIKGQNRIFFENKLVENVRFAIKNKYKVSREYGYIFIYFTEINITEVNELISIIECVPGISSFSLVKTSKLDIDEIKKNAALVLNKNTFNTFKVASKRSYKQFEYKSPEINAQVGAYIIDNLKKQVDVKNPDVILYIEINKKNVFLFINKIKGVGGLPVGAGTKVVCSMSGGIDSPVSAYMFMKRGCPVTFVHIYNNTLVKNQIKDKLKKLVKILSKFQLKSKLYMVPFSEIQSQIIANIRSDYRMIIYRRYMFKIITKIAEIEHAKAIITGDNIGQVASQTLENITSIYEATSLPIFSPLIAFDKNEIIIIAKKIGTFETSIIPYPDCCSYMISKHPKTKTNIQEILDIEKEMGSVDNLISNAINKSEIFNFQSNK